MADQLTLDGLLALAEKATPGPWGWGWRNDAVAPGSIHAPINAGYAAIAMCPRYGKEQFKKDAPYIAACSPEVVAALVRAVRAADETRDIAAMTSHVFGDKVVTRDGKSSSIIRRVRAYDAARADLDAAMRGKP